MDCFWKCWVILCGCLCAWGLPSGAFAGQQDAVSAVQERICNVFEQRKSAVVKIFSVAASPDEEGRKVLSVGTAFFIDRKGRLLANANVVAESQRLWIEHAGRPYPANCLGADPVTNLALLQVEQADVDFPFVALSHASNNPQAGSFLLAVSCKLGFEPAPSLGMLSGRNSNYGNQLLPTNYLRTDIPSDGAEGGAPVFDLEGRFVGMIVVSLPEIRASFLLPANAVEYVSKLIAQEGRANYAYLGLNARQRIDIDGDIQVCLDDIVKGGPAETAGLEKGDVLLQVGDYPIRRDEDLREAVFFARPEKKLLVKVLREGKERTFALKAAARDAAMKPAANTAAAITP